MRFHPAAGRRHTSRSTDVPIATARTAAAGIAASILLVALPGATSARTIKLPEAKPLVMFDVPDDWTMTPVDSGLELRAPDRTSVIVTAVVKRSKADLAGWQKAATQRMVAFGVTFDPNAKVPHKAAGNNGLGTLIKPQAAAPAPSSIPSMALINQPPPITMAPPPGPPAKSDTATKPTDKPAAAPLPFNSAVLYGATLAGKPVDVQFLNFALNKETAFVMQQESGSTDDRAALVIKSIRLAD